MCAPKRLGAAIFAIATMGAGCGNGGDAPADGAVADRAAGPAISPRTGAVTHGPAAGSLIIVGGGTLNQEIVDAFTRRAGGRDAPVVVIPTAQPGDDFGPAWSRQNFWTRHFPNATVLHTRDRSVADSEAFVAPLRRARGVWFVGGRQWRLADAYLHTRTLAELRALLDRGGVIGGSSAGASIQASYLVRGRPGDNQVMMAQGHEEGFGFLENAAIDQHMDERGREGDLLPVIAAHPKLLGIGLDTGTAIVVEGDRLRVIGKGRVAIYDKGTCRADDAGYYFLSHGDELDLAPRLRHPRRKSTLTSVWGAR